ncbi:MAG: glycosyltransferase family 4 protein [Bradyrhizobium sp.]|nr:glycosyltransferase family 4 protein [Bradyrhizobium sp.]
MKVLFANKFFFRNGGSEAVMFDEMELLRRRKLEVVEFSMEDERNLPSRFHSYFVSQKSYRHVSRGDKIRSAISLVHSREAVARIRRLLEDEKPDVLHCHNIYHQLTPSIITVASRIGVPVVLTLHDYKPVCPVYTQLSNGKVCTKCADGRFESLLMQRCADGSLARSALLWAEARYHALAGSYHRVSKFIAPSLFMREAVVRRFGADKVVHIPNGIDASRIQVATHDQGYVLYLGRLSREKGVETLLTTHAASEPPWRLVIAGTGPLLEEAQRKFPSAEFRGHLAGIELEAAIRGAALIVVPSEWHENSPISILEAMAYGKPIVASRIGGIPELVREGKTGLLFEPGNVSQLSHNIRTLLGNRALRELFGRNARQIVEAEHSLQAHGSALLALYDEIVRPVRRRRKAGS